MHLYKWIVQSPHPHECNFHFLYVSQLTILFVYIMEMFLYIFFVMTPGHIKFYLSNMYFTSSHLDQVYMCMCWLCLTSSSFLKFECCALITRIFSLLPWKLFSINCKKPDNTIFYTNYNILYNKTHIKIPKNNGRKGWDSTTYCNLFTYAYK